MTRPLVQLQRDFLATLRGVGEQALLPALAPGHRGSPGTGVEIYRNAYSSRLREALENDHPALASYLGDELWARLCEGYIATHPSTVRSLRDFGASLPGYLRATEPFAASAQIAELAELERRLLDCFDAADSDRAVWEALLAAPGAAWPGLRLRFHPSLQLHRVAWNSVEIWRALKAEQTPPSAMPASSSHWLLWRDADGVTRFRSLDEVEAAALMHFLSGGDFSQSCEQLLRWHPAQQVPATAVAMLQRWCDEGVIARWLPAAATAATGPTYPPP
jgi:hypothetical protein